MAKPVKYLARGAQVTAVEVTADNAPELAEQHPDALVLFTSPRDGQPYLLLETTDSDGRTTGTQRADVGGFVVFRDDAPAEAYREADAFHELYERP